MTVADVLLRDWQPRTELEGMYHRVYAVTIQIAQDADYQGWQRLSAEDRRSIYHIASSCAEQYATPVQLARGLIWLYDTRTGYTIPDCEIYPNTEMEKAEEQSDNPSSVKDYLLIRPNPAHQELSFSHNPEAGRNRRVRVINLMGEQIFEGTIDDARNELFWDTRSLISGSYYAILLSGEETLDYKLLQIIH